MISGEDKKNLTDVAIHFAERGHPLAGARAGDALLAEIAVLTDFVERIVKNVLRDGDETSDEALACIDRLRKLAEALRGSR